MNKNKNGFGILEVLIATILLVVIASSIVGLGKSLLRNNSLSGLNIEAYNYAREGLEIVRSARDTTWINDSIDLWDEDFCQQNTCYFEIDEDGNIVPVEGEEEILAEDGTKYVRYYEFSQLDEGSNIADLVSSSVSHSIYSQSRKIKVVVKFYYGNSEYNIELFSLLTNWKPQI